MPIRWDSAWYSIKSEQIWSRESTAEEFNGNDVTTLSRSSSLVLFTLFQRFQQCTSIFRFAEINFTRKHLKAGKSLIGRIVIFPQCLKSLTLPPKIFYQPNLFKEVSKVWINLLFSSSISCHTLLLRNLIFSISAALRACCPFCQSLHEFYSAVLMKSLSSFNLLMKSFQPKGSQAKKKYILQNHFFETVQQRWNSSSTFQQLHLFFWHFHQTFWMNCVHKPKLIKIRVCFINI